MTERFVRGHAETNEQGGAVELDPRLASLAEEFGEMAPPVAIIVAGYDERDRVRPAEQELTKRGIHFQTHEMSIHTNAALVSRFAETAAMRGIRVIIATAGISASLPSVMAAHTDIPVIAIPLDGGPLGGLDTLLASAQMPPGIPVAMMNLNGSHNAAVFASHILNAIPLAPRDVK